MRFVSRVEHAHPPSNVFILPSAEHRTDNEPELTAVRGLLIAASLSALFWGVCIAAVWLIRTR
jgi:hypothetical protein